MTDWQHTVQEALVPVDTDQRYALQVGPVQPLDESGDTGCPVGWYALSTGGTEYGVAVAFVPVDEEFDPLALSALATTSYRWSMGRRESVRPVR